MIVEESSEPNDLATQNLNALVALTRRVTELEQLAAARKTKKNK